MFRKKRSPIIITFILLLTGCLRVAGQGFPTNLEWQKCYGWAGNNNETGDEGFKIIRTQDGNYAAIGKKSLNGLELVWISKVGTLGNLIWETTISENQAYSGYQAQDIIQTSDGGFIVLAQVNNYTNLRFSNTNSLINLPATSKGNYDILVTKLDADGKKVWAKTFGGDGQDIPVKALVTNDNNILIATYTGSSDGDIANSGKNSAGFNQDLWLAKLDMNGSILTKKCIGGSGDETAYDMKKTADGGYIIVGNSTSNDANFGPNKGGKDALIVKIDGSMNIVWNKILGGTQKDEVKRVVLKPNGEIILGIVSISFDNDFQFEQSDVFPHNFEDNIWLVRLNGNGEVQNKKMFGGSGRDILNDLIVAQDGNFVIAGSTKSNNGNIQDRNRIPSNNNGASDALFMKVSSDFTFIWSKTLGGAADDENNGVVETDEGAYVGVGTTQSFDGDVIGNHYSSQVSKDIWFTKINYDCKPHIETAKDLSSVNTDIVASETISTTDRVSQNSSIHYGAGKSIDINPGFDTEIGTTIEFNLDGCTETGTISKDPIQIKINNECREGGMKFEFMPFTPNTDLGQYKISVQNLDPKIEFSFNGNTLITKNNLPNNGNAYFVVRVSKEGYQDFEYQSYTSTCEHDNAPIDCPENDRDVILNKEYYSVGETFTASWTGTLLPTQELFWYNENVEAISKTATTFTGKITGFPAHIQAQPGTLPDGSRPCHGSTRVEFRARK